MSRGRFDTGKPHQGAVATWVRRRLADRGGGRFDTGERKVDQSGVLLADGVGLGKTWEALAGCALILAEDAKCHRSGERRDTLRHRLARVLILVPPGLVSKWHEELTAPRGFARRLAAWARRDPRRRFIGKTLGPAGVSALRHARDLPGAQRGRQARLEFPAGTYVCNWNLLRRGDRAGLGRLSYLRSQAWDVVVVDEAHHREARQALAIVGRWSPRRDPIPTLLLSATPFQLEPRELHDLTRPIIHGSRSHKVLQLPSVRALLTGLDRHFEGAPAPDRASLRQASRTLRQVAARSRLASDGRRPLVLDQDGRAHPIPRPDRSSHADLAQIMARAIGPTPAFERWYLSARLDLATGDPTLVATKLRQALSTPGQASRALPRAGLPPGSPRLAALLGWFRTRLVDDLRRFAADGQARKTLVFTSFVNPCATELCDALARVSRRVLAAFARSRLGQRLARAGARARDRLVDRVEARIAASATLAREPRTRDLLQALRDMADDGSRLVFLGRRRVVDRLEHLIERQLETLEAVLVPVAGGPPDPWHRRRRRQVRGELAAFSRSLRLSPFVARYTGHDDQRDRDATGAAFRTPLFPWVLVASNVGSEGIDLHTHTAHLVHFDLEWNPARMEQREGRTDRFGRELRGPVDVVYLVVRGTYDERMLHQLVARQRWHSILLGRSAKRLTGEDPGGDDARWIGQAEARRLELDLRPRVRGD